MTRTSAPTIHRVLSASLAGALLLAAAGILFFSTAQPALAANPVVITVPTPGLQGGTQQLVQGTADPGDLITVDVTPVGEGTGCTATVDAAGNWVCLTTGLVTDPDLTFTATRNSGTAPPDLYQTTVSNILPPSIDGIVGGEITSSNPTPTITGTAYPGAAVHITVDNANPNVCTADGSGVYSCPWPADPPLATAPQDAGVGYPVAVYQVVQSVLNSANANTIFRLDTFTSQPQLTSPVVTTLGDHLSATTTNSTPVFSGTSEPNTSIEVYSEVGPSNSNPPVPYCATFAAASGTWSCGSTSGFTPGVWTFGVVGVDALNNASTTNGPDPQLDLTINAPNAPVISAPADGSTTYDPTATVSGTATDSPGGVVTVNGPSSTVCSATVLSDGSWTCTGTLIQGIQTISATVVNAAGTISGSASITVQLGAPGAPTFTAPAPNSTTIDDVVTFSGLANAGLGGNVNVSIGGTPACSGAVNGATGAWTCSAEVPRGVLVVQATQQDSFGIDGLPSSESFTANSPIAPIITTPLDDSTTMNPQVTFSGTATGFAGGTLTVLDGESTVCTTTIHPSSFWQCTATLAVGQHFVGVSAVDAADTFSPSAFETVTVIPLQVPPTIPKPPITPPVTPTLPAAPPTPPVSFDWSLHVFDTAGDDLTGGTAPAGTALLLSGGGIPAGYTSDAVLHSVPVELGSELIDGSGTYAIPTQIPADTPPGDHDIIVTATGPSGDTSTRDVPITVTAPANSSTVNPAVAPLPSKASSVRHATTATLGVASASSYSSALHPFHGISITPVGLAITGATTASILIFVALPSELLESTVRENYTLMFGWLTPARRRYDSWRARFRRLAIPPALTSVAVVVATSVILGFSSPEFGFNGASLRLLIALFISLAVINVGIPAIVRLVARTRLNVASSLSAMPATLLLVAASVLVSRALGVEPGFLFGVVLGVNFAVQLSRRREALLALLGIWLSMGVGVICWLAYSAIVSADIKDPGFWVLLAQEALVTTTAEAMATLVISVLPLEFLDGKTIWKWSKWAWAGTYAIALIVFIVVILPSSDEMGKVTATEWGWGAAFLAFAVLAVGLWIGFQLRRRRRSQPAESEHF